MAIIGTDKETNKINKLVQDRKWHPGSYPKQDITTYLNLYMLVAGLIFINTAFFPRSVKEWNELPETVIEAANTQAFKLALRAPARPHWTFQHFLF